MEFLTHKYLGLLSAEYINRTKCSRDVSRVSAGPRSPGPTTMALPKPAPDPYPKNSFHTSPTLATSLAIIFFAYYELLLYLGVQLPSAVVYLCQSIHSWDLLTLLHSFSRRGQNQFHIILLSR